MEQGFFHFKDEVSLRDQVNDVSKRMGEHLYSSEEELSRMLTLPPEELKETYPYKYQLYIEALRAKDDPEAADKLKLSLTRLRAINRLEKFISEAEQGSSIGKSEFKLRPHQLDTFYDLLTFFESTDDDEDNCKRGWIKLPTGSGKTMVFLSLIEATGLRALILVPNLNLINQTIEKIKDIFTEEKDGEVISDRSVGAFYGLEKDINSDIIVSTYQSVHNLDRQTTESGGKFDLVLCDEAHRALTDRVVSHALDSLGKGGIAIGLTATAEFNESKTVAHHFGEMIHEMEIKEGIEQDILSGVRCIFAQTDIDLSEADLKNGDYNPEKLEKLLDVYKRNMACINIAKLSQFEGKGQVAFCVSINHAISLAEMANKNGLRAVAIHGGLSKDEQEHILDQYENGELDMICSVDLLTEGWDSPRTEVGHMLKPTKSMVVAEQRAGRCLRKNEGKMFATIIDYLDRGSNDGETKAITMVDILGGAVVLPASLRTELENSEDYKHTLKEFEELNIEGLNIIVNAEEVMRISSESRPKEVARFSNNEEIAEILAQGRNRTLTEMLHQPIFYMLGDHYNTDTFVGSREKLIRRYYAEVLNEPLTGRSVTVSIFREFLTHIYGAEAVDKAQNDLSEVEFAKNTVRKFLDSVADLSDEEIMSRKFSIREKGNRHNSTLTGEQILKVIQRQYGGRVSYDWRGKKEIATKVMSKPEAAESVAKLERLEKEEQILGDEEYLNILKSDPYLYFKSPDEFRKIIFALPGGKITGEEMLEYNKIDPSDSAKFRQFIEKKCNLQPPSTDQVKTDLRKRLEADPYITLKKIDQIREMRLSHDSVCSHTTSFSPLLQYIGIDDDEKLANWLASFVETKTEDAKESLRQRMTHLLKDSSPFTSLASFAQTQFKVQPDFEISGKEVLKSLGYKFNHENYRAFIDSLLGKGFCKEFWPLRHGLMNRIIKDSMQNQARFVGLFRIFLEQDRMPDYKGFMDMPLKSEYLEPDNRYDLHTGKDLLAYWQGTRLNAKATPQKSGISEAVYEEFSAWIKRT